jgi:hypothetical protein
MTILEGFEDWESDEQADNQSQEDNQFLIDVEAATGLSLGKKSKKKTKLTKSMKVQEVDAGSIFSQSTIRSRTRDPESEEESDDTPKTINRNTLLRKQKQFPACLKVHLPKSRIIWTK